MAPSTSSSSGKSTSTARVVAFILGGGRGSRLYPLTRERAKPAVPLGGRYRLVDIPLSNCINSGVNRIFVLTQFNSQSLHRHINSSYKFDSFSRGFVEILAAQQTTESGDWFQGTADAIRQNLSHLRSLDAEHVLILSGDHLYRMDYRDFLRRHLTAGADITVATLPVNRTDARGLGIMKVEGNGRISEFVEKPGDDRALDGFATPANVLADFGFNPAGSREFLASMGVYLFRREVLESLLAGRRDRIDFGKHVIPESLRTHEVYSYLFGGFWEDIGTVRSYYDVSMRLVQPSPPFDFLDPDRPIYTRPRFLPGARIRDAQITNSIVCEASTIHRAQIANSIVGIRSVIQEGAAIRESILMGADYFDRPRQRGIQPLGIGPGTTIEHAIVDKNARIGRNVVIRGGSGLENREDENYVVIDGIVIVLKNAQIPDGSVIGQR